MIRTERLTKRYGPLTAVGELDLEIAPGETFGLLGPNGAGKTTTLRLLAGLAQPTSGVVTVAGHDPYGEPEAVHRTMAVVLDGAALYERLTVEENLRVFAGLHGLPRTSVAAALAKTGVADLAGRRAGALSKGQRQRVALARALLHEPSLLVLDEPTAGLDPNAAADFHALVQTLKRQGVTIILCSHDMGEVDALCDRVGVLDHGRLLACAPPAELKASLSRQMVQVTVQAPDGVRTESWALDDPEAPAHLQRCQQAGTILSIHSTEASLGEVFVHLTGRNLA